jgi:uncharacterized protein YjbI with pentapeptide repeats
MSMDEKYYEEHTFENIVLEGESLEDYEFIDCEFTDCAIENCKLINCTFSGCRFYNCKVNSLESEDSKIKYSEFTACHFVSVNWSELLPEGRFAEPISKLKDCRLKYNTFTGMAFPKFDFTGSEILESMFAECELTESSFKGCKLDKTEFFRCDIRKADFREASGYQIDIIDNKMKGARFSFPEVVSLLDGLGIKID